MVTITKTSLKYKLQVCIIPCSAMVKGAVSDRRKFGFESCVWIFLSFHHFAIGGIV